MEGPITIVWCCTHWFNNQNVRCSWVMKGIQKTMEPIISSENLASTRKAALHDRAAASTDTVQMHVFWK